MIQCMLDTNICVDILRGRPVAFHRRPQLDRMCISSITLGELLFGGWRSSDRPRNERAVFDFCAAIQIVPFDHRAAAVYGQVRWKLESTGQPIGPLDTLIASHALSLDMTLVTSNEREFRRVDKLPIENWRSV